MNNKTFHRLTILILAASMLLSACAVSTTVAPTQVPAQPQPTSSPAPTVGSEVIELIMWDIPNSDPYNQWWKDYATEFNSLHPNIKVSYEIYNGEVFKAKSLAAATANALPDIIYFSPGPEPTNIFKDGKLIPLDGLLNVNLWQEAAIKQCTIDGKVACMPMYYAPSYIYYNKVMFEKAGIDPKNWKDPTQPTWEEFLAACDALKAAGFDPIALGNGDTWPGLWWYWAFQNRYGGKDELFKAINAGGTYQSPSFIKAGELSRELANRGYFTQNFNSYGGAQKYSPFTQGNSAMMYQGTWLLGQIEANAPKDFQFGFFNFPSFKDGNQSSQGDIMAGIDAMWISANSKHPEAAAEFLNGFADPKRALDFIIKTKNIPAVKNVTPPAGQENDVTWQLAALTNKAKGVFPWWDISALPSAVNEEMMSMGQGLLLGEITPEEFAKRLDTAAGR